ncbi:uncharacterized protein LOC125647080 [Ostrea edulis]|uniref:uncharacterized protein LOC125647080 n=1 Tax=Ostrea edulis TaxID=37623 RepID=UPI0024AFC43A|nr:uncharacterized protein LOC125647080 [Ostrea edulis]
MRKPRIRIMFFGLTAGLCLLIFVYFEKNPTENQVTETMQNEYNSFMIKFENSDDPYTADQSVNTVIRRRLSLPLKGQAFNPVVQNYVEHLKWSGEIGNNINVETIGRFARSHLQPRDTELTSKDLNNVRKCMSTSKQDYQRDYGNFFGGDQGRLQNIRRTHHKYLNDKKLMIEVGGNWGWDAGNFTQLYNMNYIILEPLKRYTDILGKKFKGNEKVCVYNIGLGSKTERVMVNLEGNNACATTKFSKKNGTIPIYIVNVIDFLTDLGVGVYELDLLTMNCEGCEYEVLETLVRSNVIEKIRNIQWATHTKISIDDPWRRYCRIQELLKRTHRPTYQYKFNWENWRRNNVT